MNEVTYVFGAGASFNSMPLVFNFTDRFLIYLNFIRRSPITKKDEFLKDANDFLESIQVHLSFDTYFKKLYHQSEFKKRVQGKNILLLYFIFEHLVSKNLYSELVFSNSSNSSKKYNLDPRYDALIAGLLKPIEGRCEFFTNVNFITWNYDLNLLTALKNFHSTNRDLNRFINESNTSENEFKFINNASVFHINGYIKHPLIKNLKSLDETELHSLFDKLIYEYFSSEEILNNHSRFINFAWENQTTDGIPQFIKRASEAVKKSHIIIVIGYSFPLYNRFFDHQLFSKENLESTTIYIQDTNTNEVSQTFINSFQIPRERYKGAPIVIPIPTCNSFYVPNIVLS